MFQTKEQDKTTETDLMVKRDKWIASNEEFTGFFPVLIEQKAFLRSYLLYHKNEGFGSHYKRKISLEGKWLFQGVYLSSMENFFSLTLDS